MSTAADNAQRTRVSDDDAGLVYWVTLEERPGGAALTFLSVEITREDAVIPLEIPHGYLVRAVRAARGSESPSRKPKPSYAQLAIDRSRMNRHGIAVLYGVSPKTVDGWLRQARDTVNPETGLPYLEQAVIGRPRKTTGSVIE